jgi:hypothetical protein
MGEIEISRGYTGEYPKKKKKKKNGIEVERYESTI